MRAFAHRARSNANKGLSPYPLMRSAGSVGLKVPGHAYGRFLMYFSGSFKNFALHIGQQNPTTLPL